MAGRSAVIHTPIDSNELTFAFLYGREELNRCYCYNVGFVSNNINIDPRAMLGGALSIQAESGKPERWFSGMISQFQLTKIVGRIAHYEAVMRPWLWFLSYTNDCRIFQDMTAVEIIEEIFKKYPNAKFDKRTKTHFPIREYCVQYNESDLDFVQRLMEHEGITYFFEHREGEHTLVLTDQMYKFQPVEGYEKISYHTYGAGRRYDKEYITEWTPRSVVRPGAFTHTGYYFEHPKSNLKAESCLAFSHQQAHGELYHHPGTHRDEKEASRIAEIRREEVQAHHERILVAGTIRGLFPGSTFELQNFPREDQNREYLVISAEFRVFDPQYTSGVEFSGESFTVQLEVAPTAIPWRPQRLTPRPIIPGPQTARVVGPEGEEIYTDKHARVKVQFHWDRLGGNNERSSCFIRVSQAWAGATWGALQIPRIGQEVIVEFIEGDPDKPIITGRVYNAWQIPPYSQPSDMTKTVLRTNTHKGQGFNEISMEDQAGREEVFIRAERDMNVLVQHDRTEKVYRNKAESVGGSKSTEVVGNHFFNVGGSLVQGVGPLSLSNTVIAGLGSMTNQLSDMAAALSAYGFLSSIPPASYILSVDATKVEAIGGTSSETVGMVKSVSVGSLMDVKSGKEMNFYSGSTTSVVAERHIFLHGGEDVQIHCGKTKIKMKSNGELEVSGVNINIKAEEMICLKAAKIKLN